MTKRNIGIIGYPINHSLSPTLYNAAFAYLDFDWKCTAWNVVPGGGAEAVRSMHIKNMPGLSVTMPHKQNAMSGCDTLDKRAEMLGAVNCVAMQKGLLRGFNTDGEGLVAALRTEQELTLEGLPVTVIGVGGAGTSAILALVEAGAQIRIVSRNKEKAQHVVETVERWLQQKSDFAKIEPGSCTVANSTKDAIASSTLIIQATSLGMLDNDPLPLDPVLISDTHVVVDIIYSPIETKFLKAAKANGATTTNGINMLIYQAAKQFYIWTNKEAPIDIMRSSLPEVYRL